MTRSISYPLYNSGFAPSALGLSLNNQCQSRQQSYKRVLRTTKTLEQSKPSHI